MKFKSADEQELIGAKVVMVDTQRSSNMVPIVIFEKDGHTYQLCAPLESEITIREVFDRRGANGEMFLKNDYVEGEEEIGIARQKKKVRGWVESINEELDFLYIQADDCYKGNRGTNIKLSTAVKLKEQKPRLYKN